MSTLPNREPALSEPSARWVAKLWKPTSLRVDYLYIAFGAPMVLAGIVPMFGDLPMNAAYALTGTVWLVGGLAVWRGALGAERYWAEQGHAPRSWVYFLIALLGGPIFVLGGVIVVGMLVTAVL